MNKEKIVKPDEIGKIYRKTPNSFGPLNVDVDNYTEDELLSFLVSEYSIANHFTRPALNTIDVSHIFEYGVFTDEYGNVKLVGYITKDEIVFKDRHYKVTKKNGELYLSEE